MIRILAITVLAVASAGARTSGSCDQPFTAQLDPGKRLVLDLRAGDVEIIGVSEPELRVSCRLSDPTLAADVRIRFDPDSQGGKLTITGGPHHDFHLKISVPANLKLDIDMSAGNLTVDGVNGDKDIELNAGNLHIRGAKATDYGRVQASVRVGNIDAQALGEHRGGLFRSVDRTNPSGKYTLRAHVTAGNIEIR